MTPIILTLSDYLRAVALATFSPSERRHIALQTAATLLDTYRRRMTAHELNYILTVTRNIDWTNTVVVYIDVLPAGDCTMKLCIETSDVPIYTIMMDTGFEEESSARLFAGDIRDLVQANTYGYDEERVRLVVRHLDMPPETVP